MTSITSQCSNCQILEKTILDANSSVKKLLTLKSKIIHTDALIRQFKQQKDENEKLSKDNKFFQDEHEKSQNQCAKYEIDLKLALEELHSLRQCERDYKASSSKFQSEIFSLRESLQAEQALVKQYKSLVTAEEQAKDKDVENLEKKLSKKDCELQKSKEKMHTVSKNFNMLSRSCVRALKLLQKLESAPGLVDHVPVTDKRTFKGLCALLHKTQSLVGAADENSSDDEDEILDESQYLENLLMDSVPNDDCLESENLAVDLNNSVSNTGILLSNGCAREKTPASVMHNEETNLNSGVFKISDPTCSSSSDTQPDHQTDIHDNTNCVHTNVFKTTSESASNHVTFVQNINAEETLAGEKESSVSPSKVDLVDNVVLVLMSDCGTDVYQECVELSMETDELHESDCNDNNPVSDVQQLEEISSAPVACFANEPKLNGFAENLNQMDMSSDSAACLTMEPKSNDLNGHVENAVAHSKIHCVDNESNGKNLLSDVKSSDQKLEQMELCGSITCPSNELESNDLSGFAENVVMHSNAGSSDATDSSPSDEIVNETHSEILLEEINSSSFDNKSTAGCCDENVLDLDAHTGDALNESCDQEVTQEINVAEPSLACDYASNGNFTPGNTLPDPTGSEREVVCDIESECQQDSLLKASEHDASVVEQSAVEENCSEETSLPSDNHKTDEKAPADMCNIESECEEGALVIESECETSNLRKSATEENRGREMSLASDQRQMDEKTSECNTESEFEDGELVIASECETSAVDKSVTEENRSKETSDASDNSETVGESHNEQSKVDSPVDSNRLNGECLERRDENCPPFAAHLGVENNSETTNHAHKDNEEESRVVFRGSAESSLPPIPFSEDRQFQPGNSSKPCVTDLASNSSKENPEGQRRNSTHREAKKSRNKVNKICSRMKNALELRCPVSPLPPSPPMTPLLKESADSLFADPAGASSNDPTISDLFGCDSDDENDALHNGKSILQHQESEGFDPDTEHQEDVPRKGGLDQREVLRSLGHKAKETAKRDDESDNSDKRRREESIQQMKRPGSLVDPAQIQNKRVAKNNNNNQRQGNSSLLTDFHMDPESGHCKISIRLPDNLTSATNVRFELDTSSKEILIDYGPSKFSGAQQKHISNSSQQDYYTNEYSKSTSPMVTFPDDTPCQSRPIRRPLNFQASKAQEVSTELVPAPSFRRPLRRTTIPPLGHPLNTRSFPKKSLTIEACDKSPASTNTEETTSSPDVSQASTASVFKMPALKRRVSLAAQRKTNVDAKSDSLSSSNSTSPRTTAARTDELLLSPMSPPPSSSNHCTNNPHDENKTAGLCGKRKLDQSPPENSSKRVAHVVTISPSDSTVQRYAKVTAVNIEGCQIQANPKILKAFRPLQKVKINNSKNSALFAKLYKNLSSPSIALSSEDLVATSLVFFSRSMLEILPSFPRKKPPPQLPLLGVKEEAFVSLLKHLQEKHEKMNNVVSVFLGAASEQLNRTDKVCPTGLASLCRLHTVLCRQEGFTQAAQDLCYQFVLRKHAHAPYLIANALVVWPSVLELTCSVTLLKLRKKVLSLLLFSSITEENDQTARILRDVGNLESPGPDNQPDTLAKEILSLLTSKVDVSTSEDICQQLLLLSYTQGWSWTKDTVLPPLVDVLNSASSSVKTPVVRLIGSFLHYCGPKAKEDSDLLVHQLQTIFKELDENDFMPKESCIHNLLPLASQLDDCDVSQMKQWLQLHRSRLSPHLQQDFVNSGFLA